MDVPHGPPRGHRTRGPAIAVLAAAGLLTMAAAAAQPAAAPAVSATWRDVPLRDWAVRIGAILGRPVIVDRRLDPDTTVNRDCRDEPVAAVVAAVAADAGGAVETLPSWVRIAPPPAAGRAAAGDRDRRAEIARLPAAARAALDERRPWAWADGARPRDLVAAASAAAGVAIVSFDPVPHDHVPATALPPLPLADRLDLLLAHYDLRVSWAAGTDTMVRGTIVPLPAATTSGPPARAPEGPRPEVAPRRPKPAAADRYTLRLEAPLDEALAAVGRSLGLEPAIDRDSLAARGILPGEIVRAAVTDATRDQLLDAILAPLGLRWRIEERQLIVDAPPP